MIIHGSRFRAHGSRPRKSPSQGPGLRGGGWWWGLGGGQAAAPGPGRGPLLAVSHESETIAKQFTQSFMDELLDWLYQKVIDYINLSIDSWPIDWH